MKKALFLLIMFSITHLGISQQISHVTISSTGANIQNSNNGISMVIGELVVEQLSGDNFSLGHGFTSITDTTSGITNSNFEQELKDIHVFPNPAKNHITIEYNNTLSIKIFNELGSIVKEINKVDYTTNINIEDFETGIYYLEAIDKVEESRSYYRIIKSN